MAIGWLICINVNLEVKINLLIISWEISRGQEVVYLKILILGINEKEFLFSWSFKN